MKRFAIATILTLAAPLGMAAAAGPYDGKWSGTAVASAGGSSCSATLAVEVKNNRLSGTELFAGRSTIRIAGNIAADGSFTSSGGGFSGKFSGNSFTGTFREAASADCHGWRVTMVRAGS